ncbi:HEPN domain-containing protein [Allomeiothermus silvanus]|uniref:HEPN domain-containing protein n=1 Tax=Allomeiothermus silvanus TaxID=52022 RepID=UPI0023F3D943|nr:HEPN domain-containing protein [Allomeiothermus silvanus]
MNDVVQEWVSKAEGDYRTANREFAVTDEPNYDAVCYHAQQCIEKLMKANLIEREIPFPRTHNLVQLAGLLKPALPAGKLWSLYDLRFLSQAAVAYRYPGEVAEYEDAREALAICSRLRIELLAMLGVG